MKTTEIDKISSEHRVGYIGTCNPAVINCPFCNHSFKLADHIGYGTDNNGYIVEVYECTECFEITHHHFFGWDYYEQFKLNKQKQ